MVINITNIQSHLYVTEELNAIQAELCTRHGSKGVIQVSIVSFVQFTGTHSSSQLYGRPVRNSNLPFLAKMTLAYMK